MISLNTLSEREFYLNVDLIFKVEGTPDTLITLVNGKTILVSQTVLEVVEKVNSYKRKISSDFMEVIE